jgi:hypothetical protein
MSLCFNLKLCFILYYACALSLYESDGTVDTLRSSFPIILAYPYHNSCRSLEWLGVDIGIGRSQVVERPRVGNSCLNTIIYPWVLMLDNLRLGGNIREIIGTLEREGQGECCGYFEFFYVVAPTCVS